MFLHLGGDVIVPKREIVAILDIRSKASAITREFLEIAGDEGFIINISEPGKEKTYVITNNEIYLSPISCTTLKKRALSPVSSED
ncbi:extracellular matrix regulator RemB [Desulfotruncus alcoholivorax]|uniref:extracellular matrix regulator RemB n=1 Tax=Desulfotruncus alcoholivorax TaxID=265477 RepID=UPI000428B93E|nr:DUF370 domain-containing protein [Desulfotruncus alcoholivorax]